MKHSDPCPGHGYERFHPPANQGSCVDCLTAELRAHPRVQNTYMVNEKDPRRSYQRRWHLNVMLRTEGSVMADVLRFDGEDSDEGQLRCLRDAMLAVRRLPSVEDERKERLRAP